VSKGWAYLRENAVGFLALFVALSGAGYAAKGGFTSNGKLQACVNGNGSLTLLKTGKHCHHGQKTVAWNQAGIPGPRGANGLSGIAQLNGAPVPSATTASNAQALGGIPASGFTQSNCASNTGQVKGFALVPGATGATFTAVDGAYNCSGQPVEAEKTGLGEYQVRFQGNPSMIAVGTVNQQTFQAAEFVAVASTAPGEWTVQVDVPELDTRTNQRFELLIP
jgi:hypothetical protein